MKSTGNRTYWTFILTVFGVLLASAFPSFAQDKSSPGEERFKSTCVLCHGADGAGDTTLGKQLKVPDLRSPEVQKHTDAELKGVIANGKGNMPAFQNQFNEKEIEELVAHVRTLGKAK